MLEIKIAAILSFNFLRREIYLVTDTQQNIFSQTCTWLFEVLEGGHGHMESAALVLNTDKMLVFSLSRKTNDLTTYKNQHKNPILFYSRFHLLAFLLYFQSGGIQKISISNSSISLQILQ